MCSAPSTSAQSSRQWNEISFSTLRPVLVYASSPDVVFVDLFLSFQVRKKGLHKNYYFTFHIKCCNRIYL